MENEGDKGDKVIHEMPGKFLITTENFKYCKEVFSTKFMSW